MSHIQNCSLKLYLKRALGSGWGVRMDVNEELKFMWKFKKYIYIYIFFFGGGGSGRVGGSGGVKN